MHPPKIFISATSGDLRSIRQIVKEALLTINCHPVEQTNFEPKQVTSLEREQQRIAQEVKAIGYWGLWAVAAVPGTI